MSLFNVLSYGADPTGVADSTVAIRQAQAAAEAVGGTVYLPAGTYAVCRQATDPAPQYSWLPPIFSLEGAATWLGDGPGVTVIKGYMPGLANPQTTWTVTGTQPPISRFCLFYCIPTAPIAGTITFANLTLDGQCTFTGNSTVGGIAATGDGWDESNNAIRGDGPHAIGGFVLLNVTVTGFRGESLYNGGTAVQSSTIINCTINNCNADAISASTAMTIVGCTLGPSIYNGVENQATLATHFTQIVNSTISAPDSCAVAWLGKVAGSRLSILNSTLTGHEGILFDSTAANITLAGTTFSSCANAVILSGGTLTNGTISGCTFTGNTNGLTFQGNPWNNLTVANNTVSGTKCALLNGSIGTNVLAANNVFNPGGLEGTGGGAAGHGFPRFVNSIFNTTYFVNDEVNLPSTNTGTFTLVPTTSVAYLNVPGPVLPVVVTLDTTAAYSPGTVVRLGASKAGQWIVLGQPVPAVAPAALNLSGGLHLMYGYNGQWEVVS